MDGWCWKMENQCPKCGDYDLTVYDGKRLCLECGYQWVDEEIKHESYCKGNKLRK